MKMKEEKIEEIEKILSQDNLLDDLMKEREQVRYSDWNEIDWIRNKKKILSKLETKKLNLKEGLKVACFMLASVFLWEVGFANLDIQAQTKEESKKSGYEMLNENFKAFTQEIKNFEWERRENHE